MTPDEVRRRLGTLTSEPRLRLREFKGLEDLFDELAPAAVLIPLTERAGGMDVVLTKRAAALRKHSGEISFPGGRHDAEDLDLGVTALRETHEEIAIAPHDIVVYGALMTMPTVTGYDVTTFVGEFPPEYELVPNPAEIDQIITAPLDLFLEGDIHRVEDREWNGYRFPMHYFDVDGHNVWGATAYMLQTLLEHLRSD